MAVNAIKCTMEFSEGELGFTESHYINTLDFAVAKPAFVSLFKKRATLCGPPVEAFRGRMTLVTNGKASRTYKLLDNVSMQSITVPVKNINTAFQGPQPNSADIAKASVQCTLEAGEAHHRNLYLAGVPDCIIGKNPTLIPDHVAPTWQTDFDAYRGELLGANPWGYSGKLKPAEGGGPVVANGTGGGNRISDGLLQLVYVPAGLTLNVGDQVQTKNYVMENPAFKGVNGIWTVQDIEINAPVAGKNTVTLRNSAGVLYANVFTDGTLQNVVTSFLRYTDVVIIAQTTRKRGGRFLSTPGRRKILRKL